MTNAITDAVNNVMTDASQTATLITGGAGFIGSNLANRLLREGGRVLILDNLSRPGVEANLNALAREFPDRLTFEEQDIARAGTLRKLVRNVSCVYHFAAQVAVTTSLDNPLLDFETNVRGTVNLLEACRAAHYPPSFIYTSTNKVYGSLEDIPMRRSGERYEPAEAAYRTGVSEARPLDFHTPYGCSKGAADQYVLDYARSYLLPAAVFRMSCIYGPRQCGTEDQGWVAHFVLRALAEEPITIYGDGMQVRDILYIEDLLDAFELLTANLPRLAGQAFNIGGGSIHTVSLLEVLGIIADLTGTKPKLEFAPWRQGDQKYYVSDTRKFEKAAGWKPRSAILEGVAHLHRWLSQNHNAILTAQS